MSPPRTPIGRHGAGIPAANGVSPALITSRDNPLIKALRRLAQDNTAYRKQGQVWLEGDHLCRAALERGLSLFVGGYLAWQAAHEKTEGL